MNADPLHTYTLVLRDMRMTETFLIDTVDQLVHALPGYQVYGRRFGSAKGGTVYVVLDFGQPDLNAPGPIPLTLSEVTHYLMKLHLALSEHEVGWSYASVVELYPFDDPRTRSRQMPLLTYTPDKAAEMLLELEPPVVLTELDLF